MVYAAVTDRRWSAIPFAKPLRLTEQTRTAFVHCLDDRRVVCWVESIVDQLNLSLAPARKPPRLLRPEHADVAEAFSSSHHGVRGSSPNRQAALSVCYKSWQALVRAPPEIL